MVRNNIIWVNDVILEPKKFYIQLYTQNAADIPTLSFFEVWLIFNMKLDSKSNSNLADLHFKLDCISQLKYEM